MKFEHLITIRTDKKRKKERKRPVQPSERSKLLIRRRQDPLIIFYDLGQVNHQPLDEDPFWEDHPILKTPEYSTTFIKYGAPDSGTPMAEYRYSLEPFDDDDFQAYTDMMFNYPVEEWNKRYRRVVTPEGFSTSYEFDMRISMWNTDNPSLEDNFILTNQLDSDEMPGTYKTLKQSYLENDGWAYELDREGVLYKDLPDLTVNFNPWNGFQRVVGGYMGFSTSDKIRYKVTRENDPGAADVGVVEPRGKVEVFLMPQVGMWAATSNSADWETTEVLGLVYQVNPRHLWPRYVTDPDTPGTGGNGDDAAVAAYFEYQKNRAGMQYSVWEFFGYTDDDPVVVVTPGVPADWTGQVQWGFATVHGPTGESWFSSFYRGLDLDDNHTAFTTSFRANNDHPDFGDSFWQRTSPLLVAVIKMGGGYYYVWDISDGYTMFEMTDQEERFRIARDIDWLEETDTTEPKDGTGSFYDL